MDREIMKLMYEIHTLSHSNDVPVEKLKLLWQKLYLYEMEHPQVVTDRGFFSIGEFLARKTFWNLHDESKICPIYYDSEHYALKLDELPVLSDRDFSTEEEKLEYHIQCAIRYAIRELNLKNGKDMSSSSLYHCCKLCSIKVADYLENQDYNARVISLQDCFCPNVGHFVCLVPLQNQYYIVDVTYRQFFLLATCMEEARFHEDEAYIAPGYFVDTQEKRELLSSLLSRGYFKCTKNVLKTYADSFALAQQSRGQGSKLILTPPTNTAQDYFKAITNARRFKY